MKEQASLLNRFELLLHLEDGGSPWRGVGSDGIVSSSMCLEMYIFGLYVSRASLTARVLRSTMMWRQALLYAVHARREPTSLDQVGPLC